MHVGAAEIVESGSQARGVHVTATFANEAKAREDPHCCELWLRGMRCYEERTGAASQVDELAKDGRVCGWRVTCCVREEKRRSDAMQCNSECIRCSSVMIRAFAR